MAIERVHAETDARILLQERIRIIADAYRGQWGHALPDQIGHTLLITEACRLC